LQPKVSPPSALISPAVAFRSAPKAVVPIATVCALPSSSPMSTALDYMANLPEIALGRTGAMGF
jgi:hypothetical protein